MAHRVLNTREDVVEYERYLDDGWPARSVVSDHICKQLQAANKKEQRILELCTGPGVLALRILETVPVKEYVGLDISEASINYVKHLTRTSGIKTSWHAADLNDDAWLELVDGPYDAVVSMQSVHDLGGEREVARIYTIAASLLDDDGCFINADLLRSESDPPGSNPGRFTISRHRQLLQEAGFQTVDCTLEQDGFGCMVSTKR